MTGKAMPKRMARGPLRNFGPLHGPLNGLLDMGVVKVIASVLCGKNGDVIMGNAKEEIKNQLAEAKRDYKEVGGWSSFKSGQWLWQIIQKSFSNYWNNANVEYFEAKP